MAKSVRGGGGSLGIKYSGKLQERVPASSNTSASKPATVRGPGYSIAGGQGVPGINYGGRLHQMAEGLRLGNKNMLSSAASTAPRAAVAPLPPATGVATIVKPAAPKQQVVRNVTRERLTPTPAATTAVRAPVSRVTGNTTGFTSGKTTGSTITKGGVAGRTAQTAYGRAQQAAQSKMGVTGPARSGGGVSSKSTGPSRSGGAVGGRRGTGPAGMGSGR